MQRLRVIDSHTEGEPTRIIIDGGPDLTQGATGISAAAQREVFRARFDHIRQAVVREPRGADFLVGAMIVPASSNRCVCGVIFFNNVGFLNGCGHGTIGLAATLRHLGKLDGIDGSFAVETPVGEVGVKAEPDGSFTITNVPSFRSAKDVAVTIKWRGEFVKVVGDVAWGGNWFYLVKNHGQEISSGSILALTEFASAVREALDQADIRGKFPPAPDGSEGATGIIDHIELFGPPTRQDCRSKNFVLCPGREYDRSPCGTGTSAKVACLAAEGLLRAGESWGQESIIGSKFTARYALSVAGPGVIPMITGHAHITAESTLILSDADPFRFGIS